MAKPKSFAYFCALVSLFCCFLCLYLSLFLSVCSVCSVKCFQLLPSGSVSVYLYLPVYLLVLPVFPSSPPLLSVFAVSPSTVVAADYRPHMCTYLSKLALSNSLIKQLVNIETTRKTTTNYTHTHIHVHTYICQRETCMYMFICFLYPALNCADKILVNCVNDAR